MESLYQTLNNFGYTHPVHPTLVYLPIGCIMAAFIFSVLGTLFRRDTLLTSAKHCITLGFIALFPTIVLGYMDWQHFYGGNFLFPIKAKIALAGIFLVILGMTFAYQWRQNSSKITILGLYALCFINVIAIGYFGGELVFGNYGPRQQLPESTPVTIEQQQNKTITYADVAEIFNQNCLDCHLGSEAPYQVQLNTYENIIAGGLEGKVIIPGDPDNSELVHRIKGESIPAMPYRRTPLSPDKIEKIVLWIQQGARN